MSGYFSALMRASGMPIAGRTPAVAHAESPVVEIDVERSPAPMPARAVAAPPMPQHTVAPTRVPAPVTPLAPTAPQASDTHEPHAGFAGTERAESRGVEDAAAAVPASPAAETTKPPIGQALVRAAMQWVVADTQQVRGVAQAEPSNVQPRAVRSDEPSILPATPAFGEHRVESKPQPQNEAQADPPVRDLTTREPVAAQSLAIRSTRPAPEAPPMPVAPSDRDEVVEVSIGAIHLRVDAPVAQTIARPAATPPAAARRTPTTTSQRSGLSRRALRRI
jgi:hypothetical protein